MDDLISLLAFAAIAIVAAAFKKFQEVQAEKQRQAEPKTDLESLPEATRRMMYGDTLAPPSAAPALDKTDQEGPRRPVMIPSAPKPVAPVPRPAPKSALPPVHRPVPPRRPKPVLVVGDAQEGPENRPKTIIKQLIEEVLQESLGVPIAPRPAPRPAPVSVASEAPAPVPYREKTPPRPAKPVCRREATHPLHKMFGQPESLRWAVVMREVLGPPKALE